MPDYLECQQEIARFGRLVTEDDIAACIRDAKIMERSGPEALGDYYCMKETAPTVTILILGVFVFIAALFIVDRFKGSLRLPERFEKQSLAALSWNRFLYPVALFGLSWYLLLTLSVEITAGIFCR